MKKIINYINNKPLLCLWLAITGYFLAFSGICIWKYFQFGYNGLDLAIYNQVFFNSVNGNLFGFTIHPGSYLGDHLELFIIALLPLYYFFQHPITLLVLQSLILALSAWPIFLIAKQKLSPLWSLLIAVLWLLNPFVQNINLFEFHLLPFAIPLLLFAFYYYQQKKFLPFLIFCLLSLLVREDVALVILMFGIIGLIEKRSLKWILTPLILGGTWFVIALKIISHFTPSGTYKFIYYYGWLGTNIKEMTYNFFFNPAKTLSHIFSLNSTLLGLMAFLPFCFLNLFKPKYLLLALPIYAQLILGSGSYHIVALKLHYASLLMPALFISLIYALTQLSQPERKSGLIGFLRRNKPLVVILLLISTTYGLLTLGPLPAAANNLFFKKSAIINALKKEWLQEIPAEAKTVATYEFLTNLSGRKNIYALHYGFIGKKQLSDLPYALPNNLDVLAIDFEDFLIYEVKFPNSKLWRDIYPTGDERIRNLISQQGFSAIKVTDTLAIFKKTNTVGVSLYEIQKNDSQIVNKEYLDLNNGLKFLGWSNLENNRPNYNILPISLYFSAQQKIADNWQLRLIIKNHQGKIIHTKTYPLAYGLYPTSNWQKGEIIKNNYWFLLPQNININNNKVYLQLIKQRGFLTINGLRSAVPKILTEEAALEFPFNR
ncbi:MAG: DUF2079 domain-containing protein [Patescibacteria group bacterium]|jgi:uncharacterized membrane protein